MVHMMHMRVAPCMLRRIMKPFDESLPAITRTWVNEIAQQRGLTISALARESGAGQPTISKFMAGKTDMISATTLSRLAELAEGPLPPLIKQAIAKRPKLSQLREVTHFAKPYGSIDVWGVHPVTPNGEFRLNSDNPLQIFARPLDIQASSKLIAFYAPDDTMAPRWTAGEPVFVDLGRPGAPGDNVLIRLSAATDSPDDTETHLFRRYDGRRDGAVLTTGYGLDEQQRTPLSRLLEVRRVLTWREFFS
jgi:transcriptional regulator with XRE-family HTH domain